MKKILIGLGGVIISTTLWYVLSPIFHQQSLDEPVPVSRQGGQGERERTESLPVLKAPIQPTSAHSASGLVSIVTDGPYRFLRYENFYTINGPDLRVYLATDIQASDFIDLGPLRATEGNINYSIPSGTDLKKYRYALVWCEDFSVLFNSAELSPLENK